MKLESSPAKTRMSRGRKRVVADRQQILAAARVIGVQDGWKAVTIRALADHLGYAAPVLYEHFQNKEEVLTQLAVEGLKELHRELSREVDTGPETVIILLADRYWNYMVEQTQMYRLMNGMDGVPVDGVVLGAAARGVCEITERAVGLWLAAQTIQPGIVNAPALDELADSIWALLHGMASLYLSRAARFDSRQARRAVLQLLLGTISQTKSPPC